MLCHVTTLNPQYQCRECTEKFSSKETLKQHAQIQHTNSLALVSVKRRRVQPPQQKVSISRQQTKALNIFKTVYIQPDENNCHDLRVFFDAIKPELVERIENDVEEKEAIKWQLVIKVTLERKSSNNEVETIQSYFNTFNYIQLTIDNISSQLDSGFVKIIKSFEKFLSRGSGWTLREINELQLKTAKYAPLAGSSYIPLPADLVKKKALLNIENFEDNKCLVWCLLAHKLKLEDHANRVSCYVDYEQDIIMRNIPFPVPYQKIPEVEKLNDLRINESTSLATKINN